MLGVLPLPHTMDRRWGCAWSNGRCEAPSKELQKAAAQVVGASLAASSQGKISSKKKAGEYRRHSITAITSVNVCELLRYPLR